ncbi:Transcriptional regulator, LysR family [Pseudoalteromonas carrageenovora]|uniref:LysR family transcriptional regulator n=1 Tax=Pseudoalteromonas carrageenovora IAM 12662 TaxID=1314868 RepID=A0A2K4XAT3_PSEVC|nr:LysR family transcriptional regulator [Pseudoalteromonas carrageenovora]QBJ72304.1 Transcriptional regulator, LysR family [Pseudoalteromonas carrageenovora]GEB70824.1 transcriptional regulator [Pseudoalteromonas carrageenovora]SOU41416.1 LysR family transcriptional regulator [Pseudoalteromonas carrageenovora IAM 12662]
MKFNNRHLLISLHIKNLKSLSKAANAVHLTQSALTQGIKKLEDELNQPLFVRSHSGMTPTPSGLFFLNRVERAFEYLDEFSRIIFNSRNKQDGFNRSVTSKQLEALINLVQMKSYTAAANKLNLSQPTLHRSIKDLEQLCQKELAVRSPTGIEPTWTANLLNRFAKLFFSELRQGIYEMREFNGQMDGSLKVGSLPLARSAIVPLSIIALNNEFPDAQLSIIDGPYQEQLANLLHGEIDIIVGALRIPVQHSDIEQIPLFKDQLCIVVNAQHPLASRQTISTKELQQLEWVAPNKSTPAWQVFSSIFVSRGLPPPNHVIECSSQVAVRGILLNSSRAALLPAKQVEVEVQSGILAICPMTLPDTDRSIGLTIRKDWQPTQMQSRFLTIIKNHTRTLQSS